jgi:hypothetical protein
VKDFRAVVENTFFVAELSVVASCLSDAWDAVEDVIDRELLRKHERYPNKMGSVDPFYRIESIEEHGDAPGFLYGELLLEKDLGTVTLLSGAAKGVDMDAEICDSF